MEKKTPNLNRLRLLSQSCFLLLFAALVFLDQFRIWQILFLFSGLLGTLLFSRFYCGWICPMKTLLQLQSFLYRKAGIERPQRPAKTRPRLAGTAAAVKWALLTIYIYLSVVKGWEHPLLLLALALFLSFFAEEALWHRDICPFGTLLSLPGRVSRKRLRIDQEKCLACGICQKYCPADCILTLDSGKRKIKAQECLACGQCRQICPTEAVQFTGPQSKTAACSNPPKSPSSVLDHP